MPGQHFNKRKRNLYLREYKKRKIKQLRQELSTLLGGKCVLCGCSDLEKIEFDHIFGCEWYDKFPYNPNPYKRMMLYLSDAKQGLLQLLCKSCNASRGTQLIFSQISVRLYVDVKNQIVQQVPFDSEPF